MSKNKMTYWKKLMKMKWAMAFLIAAWLYSMIEQLYNGGEWKASFIFLFIAIVVMPVANYFDWKND